MNANELRAIQAPLKMRYRNEPDSARATLAARGRVDFPSLTVEILRERPQPGRFGLHPLTGGDGLSGCAAETLLEALVGCAGVTLSAVAAAMEIPIRSAVLETQGELDFRGTLGVSKEIPVGFQEIRLTFELESDAPDETLAKAVQLAERYCVVARTLSRLSVSWRRAETTKA